MVPIIQDVRDRFRDLGRLDDWHRFDTSSRGDEPMTTAQGEWDFMYSDRPHRLYAENRHRLRRYPCLD